MGSKKSIVVTVPKWVLINRSKKPPNAPKFIYPNCLPKSKSLGFDEKRFHWASVVRGLHFIYALHFQHS